MKEIFSRGLVLMFYMIICGFLVSMVYVVTKPNVDQAEFKSKLEAVEKVLKDHKTGNLIVSDIPKTKEEMDKYIWKQASTELFKDNIDSKVYSPAYKFTNSGKEIYVLTISGIGYGGSVTSVISFIKENNSLSLNKIEVVSFSQETPGLGANIALDSVKERFNGIPSQGLMNVLKVNKDAGSTYPKEKLDEAKKNGVIQTSDIMTGATITPRGVVNSINCALEYLKKEGVR